MGRPALIPLGDGVLEPIQVRFVTEYLKDRNATQAAIRAGYSEGNASKTGMMLLKRNDIRAAINERLARIVKDAHIDRTELISRLDRMSRVDVAEAFDEFGNIISPKKLPKELREVIEDYSPGSANAAPKIGFISKRDLINDALKWTEPLESKQAKAPRVTIELPVNDMVARLRAKSREIRGEVIDVKPE